jgi:hypothetical protein
MIIKNSEYIVGLSKMSHNVSFSYLEKIAQALVLTFVCWPGIYCSTLLEK